MIQELEPKYLEDVRYICETSLGYPANIETIEKRFNNISRDINQKIWVLIQDNKAVGLIHIAPVETLLIDNTYTIMALAVHPKCQGNGYGAQLIEYAENYIHSLGIDTIQLRSGIGRTKAHEFYEKQGFDCYHQQKCFRKRVK